MMADPFNDKSGDGEADKRPSQTIEGTAEEVRSETDPAASQEASAESEGTGSDHPSDERAAPEDANASGTGEEAELAPPRRSGGGFFTHLMAGAIGGIIGAVALFLAVSFYPSEATQPAPELEARLDALEGRDADGSAVSQDDLSALQGRVAQLEATIDSMADQAETGGSLADAAAISRQVEEAQQRLENKIDQRLAELPTAGGQAQEGEGAEERQAIDREIEALKREVASLSEAQSGERAGDAAEGVEIEALRERVAELETKIPDLSSTLRETGREARAAAITASLADLRTAVQSGAPYEAELNEFKQVAPPGAELSPLQDHAPEGIATMQELIATFGPAREAALASDVDPGEESFFDTLLSSASSVVKVRRLDGAGKGDSTEALLARGREALEAGDLDKAVLEVERLKPEAGAAMEDWLAAAKARLAVQSTLKRLAAREPAAASAAQPSPDAASNSGP